MRDRLRELNTFPYFLGMWVVAAASAFVGVSVGEAWAGGTMHWGAPTLIGRVTGPAGALAAAAAGIHSRRKRDRKAP